MMPGNMEKLGNTLNARISSMQRAGRKPSVELGTIGGDSALVPDSSPGPIPAGEYSVCSRAARRVKPGERVLFAWCGTEPLVIDTFR